MTDTFEVEAALRASLAQHARLAPDGSALAARIVAEAERRPAIVPAPRRWRTWTLPLVAAATVAAVAGALADIDHAPHGPERHVPPASTLPTALPTLTPSPQPTAPPRLSSSAPVPPPATGVSSAGLTHFRVVDITFTGTSTGYALGLADCLSGPGTCTAMARTTDGGRSWHATTPPPANVFDASPGAHCADPCVSGLRFATDEIGYAYGSQRLTSDDTPALFMTLDGGRTWARQPGGADALETLDGNVIRVVDDGGCPPGCTYHVLLAPIGGTSWRTVELPGGTGPGVAVSLVRVGRRAYLTSFGNQAGGASAKAALFSSADDGNSWSRHADPCQDVNGQEFDSVDLTTAPDGSVTALCQSRLSTTQNGYTTTSTDGGAKFVPGSWNALGTAGVSRVGAASARELFVMSDVLYRSADGGTSWQGVQHNSVGPLAASWIGFQTSREGRLLDPDASDGAVRTIWTTNDAGQNWSAYTFR